MNRIIDHKHNNTQQVALQQLTRQPAVIVRQPADNPTSCSQSRRGFLKRTIVLTGVIASGSLLASLTPTRVWALEAEVLTSDQAVTLLSMAKRLFPHETLPDAAYAILVKDIDKACLEDDTIERMVSEGVAALHQASDGRFDTLGPDAQLRVLHAMQDTPFFAKIRGQCIVSIYDNPIAYAHFGYEGEVWTKGGYLARGFDSLVWLPDPPRTASPSIYDN